MRMRVCVWGGVKADKIYYVLAGREEEDRALKSLGSQGLAKVHQRSEC